ncbi:quaternary ammonium compound efflux SMR transporter SugE [Labilibaculum euxinus]|uniref:quaternary ammonium compound efflux SMR transporter SugE n=1 Tax=Labilibaculum euxinus TaxID=2686357 RepID=UPI001783DBB2|nr:quaternary ammonium compound efflux SMR transporter SugE [Labilibaculum euxinus]MDQ1769580.1 quaternary ammonium compound efflux SMR transporter SugE [Labilibaculum euxinus]
MAIAWVYLIIAGLFEAVWAIGLKYAEGFTKLWPSVITIVAMAVSLYFLALAIKTLPVGTAYAVWTGIGAFTTAILGVVLFSEPIHFSRIFFLLLLLVSIIGLKFSAVN